MNRTVTKIPPHAWLRYLFQDEDIRDKELLKLYQNYSITSLHRHITKSMDLKKLLIKASLIKANQKDICKGGDIDVFHD